MSSPAKRVALSVCNLGSITNLQNLTAALDTINAELGQSQQVWSRAELLNFRCSLGGLDEVLVKLRAAVSARIRLLVGDPLDAV